MNYIGLSLNEQEFLKKADKQKGDVPFVSLADVHLMLEYRLTGIASACDGKASRLNVCPFELESLLHTVIGTH